MACNLACYRCRRGEERTASSHHWVSASVPVLMVLELEQRAPATAGEQGRWAMDRDGEGWEMVA